MSHVSKLIGRFEKKEDVTENYSKIISKLDDLFKSKEIDSNLNIEVNEIIEEISELDMVSRVKIYDWIICYRTWYNKIYTNFILGTMNMKGIGVKKNNTQAIYYFTVAAENGYAHAMYNIGCIYAFGEDQNRSEALKWFTKAAEGGFEPAKGLSEIFPVN